MTIHILALNVLLLTVLAQFMKPQQTTLLREHSSRLTAPLLRWSLAIILVCGFGLLGAAPLVTNKPSDGAGQSSLVVNADIALLAHSETLIAAKRFNASGKDQTGEGETSQLWLALIVNKFDHHLIADNIQLFFISKVLPLVRRYNLQQLNAPRAPPFA